jgi:hypothetical protein
MFENTIIYYYGKEFSVYPLGGVCRQFQLVPELVTPSLILSWKAEAK